MNKQKRLIIVIIAIVVIGISIAIGVVFNLGRKDNNKATTDIITNNKENNSKDNEKNNISNISEDKENENTNTNEESESNVVDEQVLTIDGNSSNTTNKNTNIINNVESTTTNNNSNGNNSSNTRSNNSEKSESNPAQDPRIAEYYNKKSLYEEKESQYNYLSEQYKKESSDYLARTTLVIAEHRHDLSINEIIMNLDGIYIGANEENIFSEEIQNKIQERWEYHNSVGMGLLKLDKLDSMYQSLKAENTVIQDLYYKLIIEGLL